MSTSVLEPLAGALVVRRRREIGVTIVTAEGEVATPDVPRFMDVVEDCVIESEDDVVLDFTDVSFLSITALVGLNEAKRSLEKSGRSMRIRVPENGIRRYLSLVGL
ncbi:STAS domain-containing protein [Amycolatopsis regifaucium]|uniref:STAS domain-containing protein n=1 Tax=Amycolatopsis regifaucium TaxID=546365 RepID=A0A154MKE6_9PSEU|nr:STAS domain-containing protein [Amycolatopsis regifaucium]KZB84776.1 hypothetical protein AVL48_31715 [Amycolatopsis regifaucium]OKA05241.1 hypothetical protein ATP06_0227170 [Amycolatopsis regifaucium]SFJ63511.1 anti-anti-sigma factor [Amycolatopsis regifaucium]